MTRDHKFSPKASQPVASVKYFDEEKFGEDNSKAAKKARAYGSYMPYGMTPPKRMQENAKKNGEPTSAKKVFAVHKPFTAAV